MNYSNDYQDNLQFWIYSKPLADFLIQHNFECLEVKKDIVNPKFFNWRFEKTSDLLNCVNDYKQLKGKASENEKEHIL